MTLNSGGTSTFSLLESLVGGEQSEGGLVPVFLHHLGHDRLVDSPGVESQVVGSLVHRSANHLLHLFLKHLVVMGHGCAACNCASQWSPFPLQIHPYLTPLSALLAHKELLRPVNLDVHHDKTLGVQQPRFLPPDARNPASLARIKRST